MKARFAVWCCLILGLGYFSETFSKSFPSDKTKGTELLHLRTVNRSTEGTRYSTAITPVNIITTVPIFLTGYTLGQIYDKKESRQTKDPQKDKDYTNLMEHVQENDKFQSKLSPVGDYVFGSLLLGLCILGLLGNGCALSIFGFRQRKLVPMEVFFIGLAVADILLSVASYPLAIIASFKHVWIFEELGCTVYGFACYFLGLSCIYTITAMAYTRYLITCKPVLGNLITCWTCCKMVASGYLLAFILAAMPLLGFGNYEVEPFGLSCTLDWIAKDRASRIYIILVTIFCVLLPLIILVFCYFEIIMLVKQSDALMKNTGVNKRNQRSSTQLTLISGLISTGFVIAWFPYTIACLWTSFQGKVVLPIWATPGPCLFAKSSIVYNPIVYVFLTERYRMDFYDLVQYITCKSGVTGNERRDTAKMVTGTNEDGSIFRQGEHSTFATEMEEHTVENSTSTVPGMKQTYV